jgi:hypothetical protein
MTTRNYNGRVAQSQSGGTGGDTHELTGRPSWQSEDYRSGKGHRRSGGRQEAGAKREPQGYGDKTMAGPKGETTAFVLSPAKK